MLFPLIGAPMPPVRAKAVCVCTRGDSILIGRAFDAVKQQTFYGPFGGGVEFADAEAYTSDMLTGEESSGQRFEATWMPLSDFAPGGPPLYPEGVYEMVAARLSQRPTE